MNPLEAFKKDFEAYLSENNIDRTKVINVATKEQKKLNKRLKVKK